MALVQIIAPKYYATLMSYGYTIDEVKALATKNQVPVEEVKVAYDLKNQHKSDTEIITYFRSQGYNETQLREFQKYLDSQNVKDSAGQTNQNKLDSTLDKVSKISNVALPVVGTVLTWFGVIKPAQNQIIVPTLPDISTLQTSALDTGTKITYDDGTGKISGNPSLTGFGLGDVFTVSNVAIFFLIVFIVYLIATSGKSQQPVVQKRR